MAESQITAKNILPCQNAGSFFSGKPQLVRLSNNLHLLMSVVISKKNRFPSTTLKASSLVRVAKTVGIDRHAIEHDVEFLLYHFISVKYQDRSNQTNRKMLISFLQPIGT